MGWVQEQVAKGRGVWLALLVMLVLAVPGFFTLPPVDRDEVLFSQASRQMLATGDFVDIHFGDATRYKKPVGIYWAQSAVAAMTGVVVPGLYGLLTRSKKSLPLSSTTMNAGKSWTSIFHTASIPSSGISNTSTFVMQS